MNIEEQKLLLEYARLMLQIEHAKHPTAIVDITPKTITRSNGYRKLRAFYVGLAPRKRAVFAKQIRAQCDAVASLLKQAAATGEDVTLGDVTIEVFDEETREPPPDPPEFETADTRQQEQPE